MTVEFVAEVDKTHTVKDKITHLIVITPTTDRPVGLFPPEFASREKEDEQEGRGAKPGPKGRTARRPTAGARSAGRRMFANKPAKSQKGGSQFPGTFTVRGTIKMCKDGKITVSAGRGPTIKAELATTSRSTWTWPTSRRARDDRVTVGGITSQARPNLVMAEAIKIELANPLSGTKKHAARSAKTSAPHTGKAKKEAARVTTCSAATN